VLDQSTIQPWSSSSLGRGGSQGWASPTNTTE
jgi:hypothetical protein